MHHVSEQMELRPGSQESIDAGTDRYWTEVAKLFNKVVLDTQSNTSIMERPDIARGDNKNIEKFLIMFRTDAFQQHNLRVEAHGKWKAARKAYKENASAVNEKKLKEAKRHLIKTSTGVFMGHFVVGAITAALKIAVFRDRDYWDEDGTFSWGKFIHDIGSSVVAGYAGLLIGMDWL